MKKLLLLVTLGLFGCTSNQSKKISFDKGYVRFNSIDQSPHTIYHIRGEMEIEIFNDFIVVKQEKEKKTFIIPSSHLVYVGNSEFTR